MSEIKTGLWQPIATAPKYGKSRYERGAKIDILAKTWLRTVDKFDFRRFPDCYWNDEMWQGVDEGWLAVAWMPIPEIPTSYP